MALALISKAMIVDLDLFHEMALFRELLQTGQMPLQDSFAYTPTIDPVVHHEWGTGALVYLLTVTAGLGAVGLVVLKYFLSLVICLGCHVNAKLRGARLPVFAFHAPVALIIGWIGFTTVRAQMFTLALLVVLFFFLHEDRNGRRWWVWVWLPLVVLWANLHGGLAAGIGILGIHCVNRFFDVWRTERSATRAFVETQHLLFAGVGSLGALYLTPYGTDYLPYLVRAVRMERPLIQEWLPIWKGGDWTFIVVWLCSIAVGAYGIWKRGLFPVFEPLVLAISAWLAGSHIRHLSIYAVVWVCLVPAIIQRTPLGDAMERFWRNFSVCLILVWSFCGLCGVGYAVQKEFWRLDLPTDPSLAPIGSPIYPVGAVEYLRCQRFQGNLMAPFDAGAFVSWHLYPAVKVSNDSRYEVAYPHGLVEEIHELYCAQGVWRETLRKYPTDAILVPRGVPLLVVLLGQSRNGVEGPWKCVYRDSGYILFVDSSRFGNLPTVDRSSQRIEGVFP
ncbi:MAG: hypothetical protein ACYC0X_33015 [Pirellulaceae bacterium]